MKKREEMRIRDPFIVPYEGVYYLYASGQVEWGDGVDLHTVYVYESTDFENWSDPKPIFKIPTDPEFWGFTDPWAPEVHIYNGKFYLFISILGKPGFGELQQIATPMSEEENAFRSGIRGTQIAVCDTPNGEFKPIANRPGTPIGPSCIDGTLYVEDGRPYHVYSHDWPSNFIDEGGYYNGEICAVEMDGDLSAPVGEPFLLFRSDKAGRAPSPYRMTDGTRRTRYGSDAPFLSRLSNGSLLLTWSPYPEENYVVLGAVSESGSIRGPWKHIEKPIFDRNGGHAMFFDAFDGRRMMCIHHPECPPFERPLILEVEEDGDTYRVVK